MTGLDDAVSGLVRGSFGFITSLIQEFHLSPEKAAEFQAKAEEQQNQLILALGEQIKGQLEINKVEAASTTVFVSGWRPFVGWTCAGTLAYTYVVKDFLNWGLAVAGIHVVPLPGPDPSIMMELIYGMLGIGGMRTYEKIKGVAAR